MKRWALMISKKHDKPLAHPLLWLGLLWKVLMILSPKSKLLWFHFRFYRTIPGKEWVEKLSVWNKWENRIEMDLESTSIPLQSPTPHPSAWSPELDFSFPDGDNYTTELPYFEGEESVFFFASPEDMLNPSKRNPAFYPIVITHAITFVMGIIGNVIAVSVMIGDRKGRSATNLFLVRYVTAT